MWGLGRRVRIGMSLALGVLIGIALLSIPAIVTPTNQASTTDAEGRFSPKPSFAEALTSEPTLAPASANTTAVPAPLNIASDELALGLGLFLIFLPASVLSILSRRWAVRKLAQY